MSKETKKIVIIRNPKVIKKDALVIADMVKNGYYAFVRSTSESFEKLRVLMANRDVIVKRHVSSINQINRWVDVVFPSSGKCLKTYHVKWQSQSYHSFLPQLNYVPYSLKIS
ncbi:transposase [Peribacillus simplex]